MSTTKVSGVDMNGLELILDADADTSITASTDDQIDIKISGADDFQFTANTFTVLSGSTLTIASGATIANSGTATGFSSADPSSADGDTLGTASAEWSDLYLADGGIIYFGNDQDVTVTHDPDDGLFLKSKATADDNPFLLTLQTGETDIAADDVLGKIAFQAPDEGTGTDAILVAAAIQARSEGNFAADANATSLDFMTGVSEPAATKMTLSSAGGLTLTPVAGGHTVFNEGGIDADFRIESTNIDCFTIDSGEFGGNGAIGIGKAAYNTVQIAMGPSATSTAVADNNFVIIQAGGGAGATTIPSGTAPFVATLEVQEPNITATGTVTQAATVWVKNAPSEATENAYLKIGGAEASMNGGVTWGIYVEPNIPSFFGDWTNIGSAQTSKPAGTTYGLSIDQASYDNNALICQSSDISHGMSSLAGTHADDAYFSVAKSVAISGGMALFSLAEHGGAANTTNFYHMGQDSVTATKSTGTEGMFNIYIRSHDGANATGSDMTANGNMFTITAKAIGGAQRCLFILDEDGDIAVDGSATVGTFDHYDDIAAMAQFDLMRCVEFQPHLAKMMSPSRFDGNCYTKEHFEGMKLIGKLEDEYEKDENGFRILSDPDDKYSKPTDKIVTVAEKEAAGVQPLVNLTGLGRMNVGAWRQAHQLFDCIIQTMEDHVPGYKAALREHLVHCDLPTQIVDWEGDHEDSPLHDVVDPGPIPEDRGIASPPVAFNA